MSTVKQFLQPQEAILPAVNNALFKSVAGTNFPVFGLYFTINDIAYFFFQAVNYGSGNITARIYWYADTDGAGNVEFTLSLAAITPNTDSQDIETKAFATGVVGEDAHLGTTTQRLHQLDITINQLDSVAGGDWCALKVERTAPASDDLTGDVVLAGIALEYSDT